MQNPVRGSIIRVCSFCLVNLVTITNYSTSSYGFPTKASVLHFLAFDFPHYPNSALLITLNQATAYPASPFNEWRRCACSKIPQSSLVRTRQNVWKLGKRKERILSVWNAETSAGWMLDRSTGRAQMTRWRGKNVQHRIFRLSWQRSMLEVSAVLEEIRRRAAGGRLFV